MVAVRKHILSAVLAFAAVLISTAAQAAPYYPEGHTGPGNTVTIGQQLNANYPGTIPEAPFTKQNARFPNQAIFGGDQTVQNPAGWTNKGTSTPWLNIPSIVLRPFGKKPADLLDATITWPVFTGLRSYGIIDTGSTTKSLFVMTTSTTNAQFMRSNVFPAPFGTSIAGGTIPNGTVYKIVIAPGRAGTVSQISIAANVVPIGGVNTVQVLKNGVTTLLVAATFDPTTIGSANTSQTLSLTGTPASLALTATDTIQVIYTSGTQGTAAVAPTVSVEEITTDY